MNFGLEVSERRGRTLRFEQMTKRKKEVKRITKEGTHQKVMTPFVKCAPEKVHESPQKQTHTQRIPVVRNDYLKELFTVAVVNSISLIQ